MRGGPIAGAAARLCDARYHWSHLAIRLDALEKDRASVAGRMRRRLLGLIGLDIGGDTALLREAENRLREIYALDREIGEVFVRNGRAFVRVPGDYLRYSGKPRSTDTVDLAVPDSDPPLLVLLPASPYPTQRAPRVSVDWLCGVLLDRYRNPAENAAEKTRKNIRRAARAGDRVDPSVGKASA